MSISVHDGVTAEVGRMQVRRVLPRRRLRTVGAWCFADHMGPAEVTERAGLDVGPHPHTGLQTVTWLMEGAILHRDSLGSEQLIRPGQVNLMTHHRNVAILDTSTKRFSSMAKRSNKALRHHDVTDITKGHEHRPTHRTEDIEVTQHPEYARSNCVHIVSDLEVTLNDVTKIIHRNEPFFGFFIEPFSELSITGFFCLNSSQVDFIVQLSNML